MTDEKKKDFEAKRRKLYDAYDELLERVRVHPYVEESETSDEEECGGDEKEETSDEEESDRDQDQGNIAKRRKLEKTSGGK